ncbi:uncharacterized protein LOC143225304 isoform X3 [Tachypleus tridentatus]
MAKGNAIDIAWKLLCKLNKENPGKMNEVKECDTKIFGERADWLPDAIRKCEKAEFPTDSLDEFLNEMCREEREADVQVIIKYNEILYLISAFVIKIYFCLYEELLRQQNYFISLLYRN